MVVFPDFAKPFLSDKNASNERLGAVSYQAQPSATTPVEKWYHMQAARKLEFLVLNCAVTERFLDYLYYAPSLYFDVYTNNNPLTYELTSVKCLQQDIRTLVSSNVGRLKFLLFE